MEKLTDKEIDIIKTCAAAVAVRYDHFEPWVNPNTILKQFGLKPWECVEDQYWYDTETATCHHFG